MTFRNLVLVSSVSLHSRPDGQKISRPGDEEEQPEAERIPLPVVRQEVVDAEAELVPVPGQEGRSELQLPQAQRLHVPAGHGKASVRLKKTY